ncbi:MAG: glycosyltransferase [Dissulfurispiraceae bacterium]
MKNRWLILSYFGNIDAMAPSHHIDDRIPYLSKKNVCIHFITSPCGASLNKDLSHIRVPSMAPSGIRYEVRYFLRKKTANKFWFKFWEITLLLPVYPFYFIEKIFLRLDTTWSWFISASVIATLHAIKNRPTILYSTGGPVSAHIAAMIASAITKIPYMAEFQDPLVHQYAAPGKFERHFIRQIERLIFKTAGAVIFLTRQAATNACERNKYNAKAFSIYAGATPHKRTTSYSRGGSFNVAHFGSLGGSRNLSCFLKAWAALLDDKLNMLGYLNLHLYGSDKKNLNRQREQFKYRETIHIHGKIKRSEAINLMGSVDVLLLIQNTDDVSFETIPSKVFEYLHTGRPILALVFRNPELQAILEEMGHIVVQADDEVAVRRGLEIYIERWQQNNLSTSALESPYTVERAVDELLMVATEVTSG